MMRINWFININEIININPGSLFDGGKILIFENNKIVFSKDILIFRCSQWFHILKINFTSIIKPVIVDKYVFFNYEKIIISCVKFIHGEFFSII